MKPFYFSAFWLPAKKQPLCKGLGIDLSVFFHGVNKDQGGLLDVSLPGQDPETRVMVGRNVLVGSL